MVYCVNSKLLIPSHMAYPVIFSYIFYKNGNFVINYSYFQFKVVKMMLTNSQCNYHSILNFDVLFFIAGLCVKSKFKKKMILKKFEKKIYIMFPAVFEKLFFVNVISTRLCLGGKVHAAVNICTAIKPTHKYPRPLRY